MSIADRIQSAQDRQLNDYLDQQDDNSDMYDQGLEDLADVFIDEYLGRLKEVSIKLKRSIELGRIEEQEELENEQEEIEDEFVSSNKDFDGLEIAISDLNDIIVNNTGV